MERKFHLVSGMVRVIRVQLCLLGGGESVGDNDSVGFIRHEIDAGSKVGAD